MTYFNGMLYHFLKSALVGGNTHFKQMHHSFSRESFKVFEYVLTQGFEPTMSISKSVLHIHWLPMFLHVFNTGLKNYINRQNCLICVPSPPSFLSDTCILPWFYIVFYWNHRPKASNKINQKHVCNPYSGRTGKELGIGPSLLCCLANPSKNQQRTRKPRDQKTKTKKRKT